MTKKLDTIGELLFWSYANLGMARRAVKDKSDTYTMLHFIIRNKLFHGLKNGKLDIRSLYYNEKSKLHAERICVYCGSNENLSIDHIIPKNKGGTDIGANLVLACRKCNSSKSDLDLLSWYIKQNAFPQLELLETYMKLVIIYCTENNLMKTNLTDLNKNGIEYFDVKSIPLTFPKPSVLGD